MSATDRSYCVYIMTNRPFGSLYIGVTNDLFRRAYEHRNDQGGSFTRKYNLKRLVYFESFPDPAHAIQREKTLKRWPREWKLTAINDFNPEWRDLFETLNQ